MEFNCSYFLQIPEQRFQNIPFPYYFGHFFKSRVFHTDHFFQICVGIFAFQESPERFAPIDERIDEFAEIFHFFSVSPVVFSIDIPKERLTGEYGRYEAVFPAHDVRIAEPEEFRIGL